MASLYDVAKRAGVPKTLVSRVIGNKSGVSEKSRARILAAMEELNYTPNALAQSLVLKKTNTIGVVLDSLSDPFFSELINGIEHEVAKTEYNVIFCSGHDHMNLKNRYITYMMQGRVDGFIIFGSYYDDEELDAWKGIEPDSYTPEQIELFREIFYTLRPEDVPGWVRSLQLRQIAVPESLRDEILLVVNEQRTIDK